ALDAQPIFVGGPVPALHEGDLAVAQLVGDLAADAAIGTDTVHFAVHRAAAATGLVDDARRHQCPCRTGLNAFAAPDTGALSHRIVEIEHDLGMAAAVGHADYVVHLDFATGANA